MELKECVEEMLADNRLSKEDKKDLLKEWCYKVEYMVSVSILHSSEVLEYFSLVDYMRNKIKEIEV